MWKIASSIGAIGLLLCLSGGTGLAKTISGYRTTSGHTARTVSVVGHHKGSGHRSRLHAVAGTLHIDRHVGHGYRSRLRIATEAKHRRHIAYRARMTHFEKRSHLSPLHGHSAIVAKQKLARPHRHHVGQPAKSPPPHHHRHYHAH